MGAKVQSKAHTCVRGVSTVVGGAILGDSDFLIVIRRTGLEMIMSGRLMCRERAETGEEEGEAEQDEERWRHLVVPGFD